MWPENFKELLDINEWEEEDKIENVTEYIFEKSRSFKFMTIEELKN